MRRFNIDLERAVAAIQEEDQLLPSKFSRIASAIKPSREFEIKPGNKAVSSEISDDISRLSLDLNAYSLDLGDSSLMEDPALQGLTLKQPVPPPLPQRTATPSEVNTTKMQRSALPEEWPPKLKHNVDVPSPDQQVQKDPVISKLNVKKAVQMRKDISETCCEIHTWSDVDNILLPPPDPIRIRGKLAEVSALRRERTQLTVEDWRSHLVRLELAENELLKDIDKFERKGKELDGAIRKAARKNKHRTENSKSPWGRSREPNRLVDSFRFSVRSQTKAPFSITTN